MRLFTLRFCKATFNMLSLIHNQNYIQLAAFSKSQHESPSIQNDPPIGYKNVQELIFHCTFQKLQIMMSFFKRVKV